MIDKQEVRSLHAEGMSDKEIASALGSSPSQINRIRKHLLKLPPNNTPRMNGRRAKARKIKSAAVAKDDAPSIKHIKEEGGVAIKVYEPRQCRGSVWLSWAGFV